MTLLRQHPFPHWVDGLLLRPGELEAINDEWSLGQWTHKDNKGARKSYSEFLPPTARAVVDRLTSEEFRARLSGLFGIADLLPDPSGFGGGLHEIHPGGYLKMHVDFNRHPSGLWRRLNLLLYVNKHWELSYGGALELKGEGPGCCIFPIGGLSVAFATTESSWHGHPHPLTTPPGVTRRSIAVYYYTKEPPPDVAEPHTTIYRLK